MTGGTFDLLDLEQALIVNPEVGSIAAAARLTMDTGLVGGRYSAYGADWFRKNWDEIRDQCSVRVGVAYFQITINGTNIVQYVTRGMVARNAEEAAFGRELVEYPSNKI